MYACRTCLPLDLCESATEVSLTEYAAVMDYYRDGQIRQAWRALDATAKRSFARDNAVEYLKAQPASAWTQHASECFGLDVPVLAAAPAMSLSAASAKLAEDISAFLAEPAPEQAEDSSEPAGAGVKREIEEAASVPSKKMRCVSTADVEAALAAGAPYSQIRAECLNYGQVLRGMICVCKVWYKDEWTDGVAVLNGGSEQRSKLLSLQGKAMTVLVLLYSDQGDGGHWALLAARRSNQQEAVLYDGLPQSTHATVIRDHAESIVTYLMDEAWLSRTVKVHVAKVPLQGDTFSCGHRCILAADHILQHVAAHACLPREIASEDLGPQHVEMLILTAARCARVKQEAQIKREAAAAPSTPKRRKKPEADMETPPSQGSSVSERVGVRPSRRKQQAASTRGRPKLSDKQLQLQQYTAGLDIAKKTGVTVGVFQKAHQAHISGNGERGHWRGFLRNLGAGALMVCTACAELRDNPPRLARAQLPDAGEGQLVPAGEDVVAPVGEQVHRPRRPRKNEAAGTRFNLANFLAAKRHGVYRETPDSLTRHKAEYWCAACSRNIKFGSMTDQNKVFAHERAAKHRRGLLRLQNLGLVEGAVAVPDAAAEEVAALQDRPALEPRHACVGIRIREPGTPLHPLEASIKSFCYAGQPRTIYSEHEQDPLGNMILEMHPEITFRAKSCSRERGLRQLACSECLKQARDKGMLKALSQKAFDIDLVMLAYKAAHTNAEEVHRFITDVRSRDYYVLGLAGQNLDDLTRNSAGLKLVRRIRARFETTPSWRKGESFKQFLHSYLTTSSLYHDDDLQMGAHAALSNALASAVQDGTARSLELNLAARVAAGGLRADAVIEQLVTSFLLRSKTALERPNSSRHLTQVGAMSDALCTLGKRKEVDALLSRFGINARAVPKTTIRSPLLPPAFGALSYSSQLRASYMRAARHLGAASSRLHVMYDETVWAPSAEQCRGFLGEEEDDLRDVIVGGQWSDNHLEAWHYLDAEQWAAAGVPVDKLAKLTLHWVVSLPTNPRWAFDTCCLPRRPKAFTADEMLQHCALYLQEITQASGGLPPRSLAYDGHRQLEGQPHPSWSG
eukprot:s1368_g12.t1